MKKEETITMTIFNNEELESIIKKKNLSQYYDEILGLLTKDFEQSLNTIVKSYRNKEKIADNDAKKDKFPFLKMYPDYDLSKLPNWLIENIDEAIVIGSSKKVVQVPDGRKYHLDNPLNHLSGQEWTYFTNSVINTRFPTQGEEGYAHHIRKVHPSPKPPQLTKDIILFFTKENEWVLDYFMGVGGTLLGATLSNRKSIGIDLNSFYIDKYKESSEYLGLKIQPTIIGDSLEILKEKKYLIDNITQNENISLILIDPPYGNMMSRKKTGEAIKKNKDSSATPFTDSPKDLGNMDISIFIESLKESVNNAIHLLKDNGHVVIFIKDIQPKLKELNLLHADIIYSLNEIDELFYLGTKIWADNSVNLFPYGYPYSFVSNQIHQYILIFKKKK